MPENRDRLPHVLVVLGNYRQGAFIAEAVDGLLAQTYGNWSCILADDCSSDGSSEIIRDLLTRHSDPRIRFLQSPENGGQMRLWRRALDVAGPSEFVAFLDADDVWHPDCLATHVAYHLNPLKSVAVTSVDMGIIDAEGRYRAGSLAGMRTPVDLGDEAPVLPSSLPGFDLPAALAVPGPVARLTVDSRMRWIWSPTSGLMFRREIIDHIWPGGTDWPVSGADFYFVNVAHLYGGSILIPRQLALYRIHGNNAYAAGFGVSGLAAKTRPALENSLQAMTVETIRQKLPELRGILGRREYRELVLVLEEKPRNPLRRFVFSLRKARARHLARRKRDRLRRNLTYWMEQQQLPRMDLAGARPGAGRTPSGST